MVNVSFWSIMLKQRGASISIQKLTYARREGNGHFIYMRIKCSIQSREQESKYLASCINY